MFNPRRLSLARERRGFTKTELARRLKVSTRTVTAWESGEFTPSATVLRRLSGVLDFPVEFFAGEHLETIATDTVSFRSMTKMTAAQRGMALAQGCLAVHLAKWLDERFELPTSSIPDLSHERDAEAAAETLRQSWGLGQLCIQNMIHFLEAKGVRVFSLGIQSREVDAFSTWKGETPFVFLNSFKSSEHGRFDAAHELGHLVLHRHAGPSGHEAERQANRFASAFLMPRGDVLAEAPRRVTINGLIGLKSRWIVSLSALTRRLHEVGILSDWQYRSACVQISKRGYRTHEPHEAVRERSLVLSEMLSYLYREEGVTRAAIARDLAISVQELEEALFGLVLTFVSGGRRGAPRGPTSRLARVK